MQGPAWPLQKYDARLTVIPLDQGLDLLCLGGDHAVTFSVVKTVSWKYAPLNILPFNDHSRDLASTSDRR
jgi:arginase family enzyme